MQIATEVHVVRCVFLFLIRFIVCHRGQSDSPSVRHSRKRRRLKPQRRPLRRMVKCRSLAPTRRARSAFFRILYTTFPPYCNYTTLPGLRIALGHPRSFRGSRMLQREKVDEILSCLNFFRRFLFSLPISCLLLECAGVVLMCFWWV